MKLLTIETRQYLTYYHSRYQQVLDLGVDLYVLNGEGTEDFWPAERYRLVGTKHIDDMIACAKEWHATEQFDGVITFSEAAVIAVAAIADALGLPGIGVEAARNSRNKALMREAYRAAGVPVPRFTFVTELDDALAAAEAYGYPVILKPTLGAGSHFVYRVDDAEELRGRFEQAMAGIREMFWVTAEADGIDLGPQGLLVESFLDGREYLMEALAWDDEVYLGSVVDRITAEGKNFDDDVHHAPTSLDDESLAKVHRAVKAAAHAQGLRRSVMHAEVRFHDGEPHLLEIAARVGGGGLDQIARLTAGYDPIAAVVDVGRGVRPRVGHYNPLGEHIASMCLICDAGIVRRVEVPKEVGESERVFLLKITARPGDVILRPPNGNTIFGFLGVTGTSEADALAALTELSAKITVELDAG
ncbi:ATP-grasp domain-containing protein [Dactylosporangium roseum]|uniref:ATP-grasp domain-containing protein n=1 Tax=Dactylosporangium roseum TaxID=47989 RepID=A0ABY5ZD50_9ACTN|nr:ATP-grasp domain-containing protein [Dactylosporangium roseum]UWZ39589.1 ATP-grasp domain-containing protein [Dactylosporangium roseum]